MLLSTWITTSSYQESQLLAIRKLRSPDRRHSGLCCG